MGTKKAIFIGNSFIYYGGCVQNAERNNDRGLFFRIANQAGLDITVTDATWGGRILAHFTAAGDGPEYPTAGQDLLGELDLWNYDYCFISEAGRNNKNFLEDFANIRRRFPNPKTEFFYLVHNYTANHRHEHILDALPTLSKQGVTIIPWGLLVYDIWVGNAVITGAKCLYNKNSFIVKQSASDGYHPNPLSGYITAQMCLCAVTGKSAVGTDTSFCADTVDFGAFIAKHYGFEGSTTNFPEILSCKEDIRQIQVHCDEYLIKYNS